MNAIDELKHEHQAIQLSLRILGEIQKTIERTGLIENADHLENLLEFFTVFVDHCHHGKEEELLFPAMEAVGVSKAGGPLGVMLNEHQQGRDLVKNMKTDLAANKNGQSAHTDNLIAHIKAYISLLHQHIDKENNVLFVMASTNIDEQKLIALKAGFDEIEASRIGGGVHERFHHMLKEFEEKYLI